MTCLVFWSIKHPLPEPQYTENGPSLELHQIKLKLKSCSGPEINISGARAKLKLDCATEIDLRGNIRIQRGDTSIHPKRVFVDLKKSSLNILDLDQKGPPTLNCPNIELTNKAAPIIITRPHFGGLIPMTSDRELQLFQASSIKGNFNALDAPFLNHQTRSTPKKSTLTEQQQSNDSHHQEEPSFSLSSKKGTLLVTRVGARLSLDHPIFSFKGISIQAEQARIRSGQRRLIFSQRITLKRAETETHLDECELDLSTATVTSMDQRWSLLDL